MKKCFLLFLMVGLLYGSAPRVITYQGKLTDHTGVAVNDTTDSGCGCTGRTIAFFISDADSNILWSDTVCVKILKGLFSVQLDLSAHGGDTLDFGEIYYLQLMIDSDDDGNPDELLIPRQKLTAAPYAFTSVNAETALAVAPGAVQTDGSTITGDGTAGSPLEIPDGAITGAKIASMGAATGQVLKWNGTTWAPANDDTASGGAGQWSPTPNYIYPDSAGEKVKIYHNGSIRVDVSSGISAGDVGMRADVSPTVWGALGYYDGAAYRAGEFFGDVEIANSGNLYVSGQIFDGDASDPDVNIGEDLAVAGDINGNGDLTVQGAATIAAGGFGYLNMNNQRVVNLGEPTASQDAVTKNYVDSHFLQTVYANSPLEGNGTSSSPLAIADGGIGSSLLADGAITQAKIADGVTFVEIQNNLGTHQFYVADSNRSLRFEGTGYASVNFDPATHRVIINATGDGVGTDDQSLSWSGSGPFLLDIEGSSDDAGVAGGVGISLSLNGDTLIITNTGDVNPGDDITNSTVAGGDLYGTFPNPSVAYADTARFVHWDSIGGVPAGFADGVDDVDDADNVVGNEYNTGISFDDGTNILSITDGGGTLTTTINNEADDLSDNSINDLGDVNTSGAVAGQVLKWNGTAWAPANDSGGIAGTGTANYIPKWNSASVLGSSQMYDDGTRVAVGTSSPEVSAKFEVYSKNGGFLPPRMTTAQRDSIPSPVAGLIIYNTTTGCLEFYGGSAWQSIACGCTSPPPQPGAISGPTSVCGGDTATYSISPVTGANSYTWSVPSDATIISGQGTTTIDVVFGSTSGTISVTADNDCGSSTPQTLSVTVGAASGADTFEYTGSEVQFIVPDCATSLVIEAWGGQGGDNTYGGKGAYLKVRVDVTPGETLTVYAGKQGVIQTGVGGGGDASYVARGNTPLVVAAGGGGGWWNSSPQQYGGAGSATQTPTSGTRSNTSYGWGTPGTGGNGGGAGSGSWGTGGGGGWYTAGGNGSGTAGGAARGHGSNPTTYAGGAGGGYNGAGGADMDSGWGTASCGGGGSYYSGTLIDSASGAQTGNGRVIISW